MKKFYIVGIIILLMMSGVALFAQNGVDDQGNSNDPNLNPRANACYVGGSLEGSCDTDWKWVCGWSIIRLEYGLLSREILSELCQSLLAPLPTATPNEQQALSNTNITSLPPLPTFTLPAGPTNTATNTPTDTPTGTITVTPTDTPTNTPTVAASTATDTPTNAATVEPPTPTDTPTSTPTLAPTDTPTSTATP